MSGELNPATWLQAAWLGVLGLLLLAAISDWRERLVPDAIPLAILSFAVLMIAVLPAMRADWISRALALLLMLVVGTVLGNVRALGGGDIKLLAALAPWHGLETLAASLVAIAAVGGLLAIGFIAHGARLGGRWNAGLRAKVPYAVAILFGEAAFLFYNGSF